MKIPEFAPKQGVKIAANEAEEEDGGGRGGGGGREDSLGQMRAGLPSADRLCV